MSQASRILLVDDGEEVRKVLMEILCWLGYEVDAVSSGEEALEAFDEARHALLITDHCMPWNAESGADPGLEATVPFAASDRADRGR